MSTDVDFQIFQILKLQHLFTSLNYCVFIEDKVITNILFSVRACSTQ